MDAQVQKHRNSIEIPRTVALNKELMRPDIRMKETDRIPNGRINTIKNEKTRHETIN